MSEIDEQLEFAISEYLDGDLPFPERAALEKRFAEDPQVAALLAEYRKIDAAVKNAPRIPAVDYTRLAAAISGAVADEVDASRRRIGFFRETRVRVGFAAALAACLVLGISIFSEFGGKSGQGIGTQVVAGDPIVIISGPMAEAPKASAKVVAEVQISAPSVAQGPNYYALEPFSDRPTRIQILAADVDSAQDNYPNQY